MFVNLVDFKRVTGTACAELRDGLTARDTPFCSLRDDVMLKCCDERARSSYFTDLFLLMEDVCAALSRQSPRPISFIPRMPRSLCALYSTLYGQYFSPPETYAKLSALVHDRLHTLAAEVNRLATNVQGLQYGSERRRLHGNNRLFV